MISYWIHSHLINEMLFIPWSLSSLWFLFFSPVLQVYFKNFKMRRCSLGGCLSPSVCKSVHSYFWTENMAVFESKKSSNDITMIWWRWSNRIWCTPRYLFFIVTTMCEQVFIMGLLITHCWAVVVVGNDLIIWSLISLRNHKSNFKKIMDRWTDPASCRNLQ